MKSNSDNSSQNQIAQTIRECFFLESDYPISETLLRDYAAAQLTGDLSLLSQHTQSHHTDQFAIHITHDIDWLSPFHPYSFLKFARSLVSKNHWLTTQQLLNNNIFLQSIEQLLILEKELDLKGIYCIGATKGLQLNRFDIRYRYTDSIFNQLVKLLQSYNTTIGLHSSFDADSKTGIAAETDTLASILKQPILVHRSHFLHYKPSSLYPQLAAANIKYDFGYGVARKVGLLNGFPGKYKPLNPITGNSTDVTIVPLILLDNVFFVKPFHEVMYDFRKTLQQLKQYNGSACILFHPENMILKPQLWSYFEEIIHICKEEGAFLNPPL